MQTQGKYKVNCQAKWKIRKTEKIEKLKAKEVEQKNTIKGNIKEIEALNSENQRLHKSLSSEKEYIKKKNKKVIGILQRKMKQSNQRWDLQEKWKNRVVARTGGGVNEWEEVSVISICWFD